MDSFIYNRSYQAALGMGGCVAKFSGDLPFLCLLSFMCWNWNVSPCKLLEKDQRSDQKTTSILTPGKKARELYHILDRTGMKTGDKIHGPCLILSQNSTALVPEGWNGLLDEDGTIQLVKGGGV